MKTSRKIQIALGTILLWSSTSVSSFAATNTITPGKNQSDTVNLPVESTPSRQLNPTQYNNLVAQSRDSMRFMLGRVPGGYDTFKAFDEIWKNRADRKQRFLDYCNSQKLLPINQCFSFLLVWTMDIEDTMLNSGNFQRQDLDDLDEISTAVMDMRRAQNP